MEAINVLLLVEDDENDVVLTERKIQRAQLPITELLMARTLGDAQALIKSKQIDVILLDLNMDLTRGLDTLKLIRPIFDGTLIVMTSIDDESIGIEAIRLGAEDYLIKNRITEERLRSSVSYAMTRHEVKQTTKRTMAKLDSLNDFLEKVQ